MTSKIAKVVPEPVEELRVRVDQWRRDKSKKHKMPKELWEAAVEMAKRYGVNFVSASLALGYKSLKQKVQGNWGPVKTKSATAGFVDITASSIKGASLISLNEMELHRPDGRRVVIRNADTVCVSEVVRAFFGQTQ